MNMMPETIQQQAQAVLVGSVNSPVRSFKSVAANQIFITKGKGAYLYDSDDNELVDYVCSWGALPLGHAHQAVVDAMKNQLDSGASFGITHASEIELAQLILNQVKQQSVRFSKVRFVSSGTEACMTAVRLARGVTKRKYVIKFVGCYHGHADQFLIQAGSGALTLSQPTSLGVPEEVAKLTLLCEYNDHEALSRIMEKYGTEVAAIIVEPVAGNMGLIAPCQAFASSLQDLSKKYGALLIADEVMAGYRAGWPTACKAYGINADILVLGKVIGGGMNVAAVVGPDEIMNYLAPIGGVYQAGTLSGNPVAMAAGIATLKTFTQAKYSSAVKHAQALVQMVTDLSHELQVADKIICHNIGTMFCLFFARQLPANQADVSASNIDQFNLFFKYMLANGVLIPPSAYEAWFISSEHNQRSLDKTRYAMQSAFNQIFNQPKEQQ